MKNIIVFLVCLIIAVGIWSYFHNKPDNSQSKKIIITETYFERNMAMSPEQFTDVVTTFAKRMEAKDRTVTIKIFTDVNVGGIVGALVITEDKN